LFLTDFIPEMPRLYFMNVTHHG